MTRPARPDPWRRDPNAAFDSLEREQYAQARAKGHSIKSASAAAGVTPPTGTTYERHDAMRLRIRELRQGAETYVGVSKAWVLRELQQTIEAARDDGAYKAAIEGLALVFKIISEDRSIGHEMARALPHDVTPEELQKRLRASFRSPTRRLPEVRATAQLDESMTLEGTSHE